MLYIPQVGDDMTEKGEKSVRHRVTSIPGFAELTRASKNNFLDFAKGLSYDRLILRDTI